jgi:hypothetical protein
MTPVKHARSPGWGHRNTHSSWVLTISGIAAEGYAIPGNEALLLAFPVLVATAEPMLETLRRIPGALSVPSTDSVKLEGSFALVRKPRGIEISSGVHPLNRSDASAARWAAMGDDVIEWSIAHTDRMACAELTRECFINGFVKGHDFGRADKVRNSRGFNP